MNENTKPCRKAFEEWVNTRWPQAMTSFKTLLYEAYEAAWNRRSPEPDQRYTRLRAGVEQVEDYHQASAGFIQALTRLLDEDKT